MFAWRDRALSDLSGEDALYEYRNPSTISGDVAHHADRYAAPLTSAGTRKRTTAKPKREDVGRKLLE